LNLHLLNPTHLCKAIAQFFKSYSCPLESDAFRRILTHAINSAKSSNLVVRENSIKLFKTVTEINNTNSNHELAVVELLSLPKTGKTAGPDHRVTLYSMLAFLTPSSSVSASIIQTTLPLLTKETHDTATGVLASAMLPHLANLLRDDATLPPGSATLIAKEMNNSRPVVRRAFCSLAGGALWENGDLDMEGALAFARAVLPSFENNLKNVSSNPLNSIGGPLEGYIATAVLLGPFFRSGKFSMFRIHSRLTILTELRDSTDEISSRIPIIQSIPSSTAKPSFLLWDKVYQRNTDIEDEKWLLNAIDVALRFFHSELSKSETFRSVIWPLCPYSFTNVFTAIKLVSYFCT
jgi:Domain of unknown function (DUF3554).